MQSPNPEAPARVVMLWPADLKAQIQAEVGPRGLTAYVLEAIAAHRAAQETQEPVDVAQVNPEPEGPEVLTRCDTCGADLEPDGSCWVCS